MPNQQSWMSRWIFSVMFPRLISKHVLYNIKIDITDGDSQELTQIYHVIQNVISNAKKIWCGWRIISQDFDKHVNTTFPDTPSSVVESCLTKLLNLDIFLDEAKMCYISSV